MSWKVDAIYYGRRLPDPHRPHGSPLDTAGPITVKRSTVRDRYVSIGPDLDPAPSLRLRNHSPDGFNWGYSGSGPAQLALALLLDFTGRPELAELLYQDFKFSFVAGWGNEWALAGDVLAGFIVAQLCGYLAGGRLSAVELAALTIDAGGDLPDAAATALTDALTAHGRKV